MKKRRKKKAIRNPDWAVVIDKGDNFPITLDSIWDDRSLAYLRDLELSESGENRLNISVMTTEALSNLVRARGIKSKDHSVIASEDIDDIIGSKEYIINNPRTSLVKRALQTEALRHDNFDAFAEKYWLDCSRGIYWYATDKEKYTPSEKDISDSKLGRFFVSCNPDIAFTGANAVKNYIAEIDVTGLDSDDIESIHSTAGLKISLKDLSNIKIIRTIAKEKSLRAWKYQMGILPSSKEDLHKFYENALQQSIEEARKRVEKDTKRARRADRSAERESVRSERRRSSSERIESRSERHRAKMDEARERRAQRSAETRAAAEGRKAKRLEKKYKSEIRDDAAARTSEARRLEKKIRSERKKSAEATARSSAKSARDSQRFERAVSRERTAAAKAHAAGLPIRDLEGDVDLGYPELQDVGGWDRDLENPGKKSSNNTRLIPKNVNVPSLSR